jgi:hypothetical protein
MKNLARRFSEVLVSIVGADGTERMAKCLLDTGCTKSMILKKFTEIKRRNKLSKEDTIEYETYGGKFKSSMTAQLAWVLRWLNSNNIEIKQLNMSFRLMKQVIQNSNVMI